MKEITSTLTSKGQVTIPVEVRRHLGVKEGDKIVFVIDEEGTVRVVLPRYPTIASLRGAAGKLERPLSRAELLEIAHSERTLSIMRKLARSAEPTEEEE